MFYSITGNVVYYDEQIAAVNCNGVAFKCFATKNTISSVSSVKGDITLFTHLNVREDALDLFGFYSEDELNAFKFLIGVSGVGPKVALSVLSELTPSAFALAVISGDYKAISAANGVGQKTAQRIIMELKDKLSNSSFASDEAKGVSELSVNSTETNNFSEAVSALVALGYSRYEATSVLSKADKTMSVEELIKFALKNLAVKF